MFTTFVAGPPQSSGAAPPQPVRERPKRSQVSRACEWCRVHRIKCDANYPSCANCKNRGGKCSRKGAGEVRSLPHALREIERLRLQVKELEKELRSRQVSIEDGVASLSIPCAPAADSTPSKLDLLNDHGGHRKYWEGIHMRTAHSHQTQWYGPSSSFYFIGRMSHYLDLVLQQPHSGQQMQPTSASRSFDSPTSPGRDNFEALMSTNGSVDGDSLTGTQEDFFLGLFWQSLHCTLPIIDEAEFREHYKSLWATPGKPRKPSALVDIVLALSMQYGVASIPRNEMDAELKTSVDNNDATIAGRWFYSRCQTLLAAELESPSITTLQCHIFSVVYLCCGSFQNMAHSTLALATRTAQILGLHLEPPEDMPRAQRELRKRIWWTLYAIESKTCMKLGRPWSAELSRVTCSLPADDHEVALISGSSFASFGENITWLSYGSQVGELILSARAIYISFYDKCADILGSTNVKSIYGDTEALEASASFLSSCMECMHTWLRGVPEALKTKRKGLGETMSTDMSPLEVEIFAPLWLRRQRVLLELLYHNLSMNLYRPFICFNPSAASSTPLSDGHAISCVNHAMAITKIMYQMIIETDLLAGYQEAYQWQWNATLSLIGFMLGYPRSPITVRAREAITTAISVFETFGRKFAVAASAANVTRDLCSKADYLVDRFLSSQSSQIVINDNRDGDRNGSNLQLSNVLNPNVPLIGDFDALDHGNSPGPQTFQNLLADPMGMAFAIDSSDSLNSFEPLNMDGIDFTNMWTFSQD